LTPRQIRFTATALRHVRREKAWWREHRHHIDIFAQELEEALKVIALLPGAGSAYSASNVPGLRRLYLPKTACHVYYTFGAYQVIVRAVWGARRERGPNLRS